MLTDRDELIGRIREAVDDLPWLVAAWLGGSDASGRVDALSDVDLQLVVEDEKVEEAFIAMEAMLGGSEGIEHLWRVAEPTWHAPMRTCPEVYVSLPDILLQQVSE